MGDEEVALPQIADRYDVLDRIGQDSLFTEFRARDRVENRIVRLRLLRADLAESAALLEALRRDLGAVFALQSRSVARILDIGDAPPPYRLFVVEEFSRSVDLSVQLNRSGPMRWESAVEAMVPVAEALVYALDRGIVHGTLAPERVAMDSSRNVLVRGYGESVAMSMARRLRGEVGGGQAGLPPECRGGRLPDHPLHDIWMFGALFYALLCGRSVGVESESGGSGVGPDPRLVKPGVPEAVAGIVMKCLADDPADRYPNPRLLLGDLGQVLSDWKAGESLAWNPLARPHTALSHPVPSNRSTGERPRVAPGPGLREEPMKSRSVDPEQESPERRQMRYLTLAMIVSAVLLAISVGVVVRWVQPFLAPASEVLVPNLVGLSETEGAALARERGIAIQVVDRQFRDDQPEGRIYQMREKVGDPMRPGQPVAVWVSKGPELVDVPDVTRMGFDKARQILESSGLKVGTVTRVYDFSEPSGNVVEQSGLAGERKPRGTAVNLNVSRGPEPEPVPEPVSDPIPAKPPVDTPKPPDSSEGLAPGERFLSIPYEVPSDGKSHRIRVDVDDEDGLHTGYDQAHEPGESVKIEVKVVGAKATIRLYDNDALKGTAQ